MDSAGDTSSTQPFGQYPATREDGVERPRLALTPFSQPQGRIGSATGMPKISKSLMKPFKFSQKIHENVPPKAFRFPSLSGQPSTPVRPFASSRLASSLKVASNDDDGRVSSPDRLGEGSGLQVGLKASPSLRGPQCHPDLSQETSLVGETGGFDVWQHVARDFSNLKQQNVALRNQNEDLARAQKQSSREIEQLQAQVTFLTAQVNSTQQKYEESQQTIAESTAQLGAAEETISGLTDRVAALSGLTAELDALREDNAKLKLQGERANAKVDNARKIVARIRESNGEQLSTFRELKKSYDDLKAQHDDTRRELRIVRQNAIDGEDAVQSFSSTDIWVSNARQARELLNDVKADLDSSRRVCDMLRDKLHHFTSLLLESQERVKDLEDEKSSATAGIQSGIRDVKDQISCILTLDTKYQEILDRLSAREKETIGVLAEAAKTQELYMISKEEISRLVTKSEDQEAELGSLRSLKEEHLSRVLAMQDVVNARDQDITALRTELKTLHESKADLRALLAEAKKCVIEKDQELTQARNLSPQLEALSQEVRDQFASHQNAVLENREILHKLTRAEQLCAELVVESESLKTRLEKEEASSKQWRIELDRVVKAWQEEKAGLVERHRQELQLKEASSADMAKKHRQDMQDKEASISTLVSNVKTLEKERAVVIERHRQELQDKAASLTNSHGETVQLLKTEANRLRQEVLEKEARLKDLVEVHRSEKEANSRLHSVEVKRLREDIAKNEARAKELADVSRSEKEVLTKKLERKLEELESKDLVIQELQGKLSHEKQLANDHKKQAAVSKTSSDKLEKDVKRLEKERTTEKQRFDRALADMQTNSAREADVQTQLVKAQELRAVAAENAYSQAQKAVEEERAKVASWQEKAMLHCAKIEELEGLVRSKEAELRFKQEEIRKLGPRADLVPLRDQLQALTVENEGLRARASSIMDRYQTGDLTDAERDLIHHVVSLIESSNEQRFIEKDNEIRSRGNQLATSLSRIKALQKQVAELLDKRDSADSRPIVNIRSLAASSPITAMLSESGLFRSPKTAVAGGSNAPGRAEVQQQVVTGPVPQAQSKTAFSRHMQARDDDEIQPSLSRLDCDFEEADLVSQVSQISEYPEPKKRERPLSPLPGETVATKKRTKVKDSMKGDVQKTAPIPAKKVPETSATSKSRQRKRK